MKYLFLLCFLAPELRAEEIPFDERKGFEEFFQAAVSQGHQLKEQSAKIDFAKAREDEVSGKWLPSSKITALVGPVPGAEGNAITGENLWDEWGVLSKVSFEVIQPLYTFGSLAAARRASKSGREAEENLLHREKWKLRREVGQLYYGYQLAFEFREFSTDLEDKLRKALDSGESLRKRKTSSAPSLLDLDKLRVYLFEAEGRKEEANLSLEQIRTGMSWKTGIIGSKKARWDQANLSERVFAEKSLEELTQQMTADRAEWKALENDVAARQALYDVQRKLSMPMIFAAGKIDFSSAPARTDQSSPFAYDPANDFTAGIALGIKWDFDLFYKNAEKSKARAEWLAAQAREQHYKMGLMAEVEKNYWEWKKSKVLLEKRQAAAKLAKRVFTDSYLAFTLGTLNAKSLLEALATHVNAEKARLENLYQYNLSVLDLESASGSKIPNL